MTIPSKQLSGIATITVGTQHYYANTAIGNDAYDGLTVDTPKLTLGAVGSLAANFNNHETVLHVAGTFSDFGIVTIAKMCAADLVIDGDDDVTIVAGPFAADIHSTTTIGNAAAGWVIDAHRGYMVEILSGDYTGLRYCIQKNTTTTITPAKDFPGDPGACNFQIIRPTTTLTAAVTDSELRIVSLGGTLSNTAVGGSIRLQRLYITGSKATISVSGPGTTTISCVISDSTATTPINIFGAGKVMAHGDLVLNTTAFPLVIDTNYYIGVTIRGSVGVTPNLTICNSQYASFSGGFLWFCSGTQVVSLNFINGQRFCGTIYECPYVFLNSIAGYAKVNLSNSTVDGLALLYNCLAIIQDNVDISNNAVAALALHYGSSMRIQISAGAVLSGSGNVGALYVGYDCVCTVANGSTPTVSGTVWQIVTIGGAAASWAQIDAGTVLADLNYMTNVREIF